MGQKRGNPITCAVAAVDSVSSALPLFFDPTSPPVFRKTSAAACLLALSRRQACLHTPSLPLPSIATAFSRASTACDESPSSSNTDPRSARASGSPDPDALLSSAALDRRKSMPGFDLEMSISCVRGFALSDPGGRRRSVFVCDCPLESGKGGVKEGD